MQNLPERHPTHYIPKTEMGIVLNEKTKTSCDILRNGDYSLIKTRNKQSENSNWESGSSLHNRGILSPNFNQETSLNQIVSVSEISQPNSEIRNSISFQDRKEPKHSTFNSSVDDSIREFQNATHPTDQNIIIDSIHGSILNCEYDYHRITGLEFDSKVPAITIRTQPKNGGILSKMKQDQIVPDNEYIQPDHKIKFLVPKPDGIVLEISNSNSGGTRRSIVHVLAPTKNLTKLINSKKEYVEWYVNLQVQKRRYRENSFSELQNEKQRQLNEENHHGINTETDIILDLTTSPAPVLLTRINDSESDKNKKNAERQGWKLNMEADKSFCNSDMKIFQNTTANALQTQAHYADIYNYQIGELVTKNMFNCSSDNPKNSMKENHGKISPKYDEAFSQENHHGINTETGVILDLSTSRSTSTLLKRINVSEAGENKKIAVIQGGELNTEADKYFCNSDIKIFQNTTANALQNRAHYVDRYSYQKGDLVIKNMFKYSSDNPKNCMKENHGKIFPKYNEACSQENHSGINQETDIILDLSTNRSTSALLTRINISEAGENKKIAERQRWKLNMEADKSFCNSDMKIFQNTTTYALQNLADYVDRYDYHKGENVTKNVFNCSSDNPEKCVKEIHGKIFPKYDESCSLINSEIFSSGSRSETLEEHGAISLAESVVLPALAANESKSFALHNIAGLNCTSDGRKSNSGLNNGDICAEEICQNSENSATSSIGKIAIAHKIDENFSLEKSRSQNLKKQLEINPTEKCNTRAGGNVSLNPNLLNHKETDRLQLPKPKKPRNDINSNEVYDESNKENASLNNS